MQVGGETCSICHDDMQKAAALPCGHCFHRLRLAPFGMFF